MGGGLLQLVAIGQMDQYLSINPDFSYYQYVYKKHSHFSMESRQLTFSKAPVLAPNITTNICDCVIARYGDLLSDLYFCFTLPNIYSSDKFKFRWIANIGNVFIKKASMYIDGTCIDQLTGEWMNIWNELILPANDNKTSILIGNTPNLTNPQLFIKRAQIVNNKFIYYFYPASDINDPNSIPSIKEQLIIVPLRFWFTLNPALALPLLRLQLNTVYVRLELESSEKLYQVYSPDIGLYVSPIWYNQLHSDNINILTFTKNIALNAYIDANYIFLGQDERNTLFLRSKLTYLCQQLTIVSTQTISSKSLASYNINVLTNNPTKELIWTLKRNDCINFNDYNNYTASIPQNDINFILDKAYILFNNNNRIEEKPAEYFHLIQPYQHHSKIPRQGIYSYSFAIYPEKEILSGYYNAGMVRTTLSVSINNNYDNSFINSKLFAINKPSYDFDYLINVYSLNYNLFEIIGNQAGMKFVIST